MMHFCDATQLCEFLRKIKHPRYINLCNNMQKRFLRLMQLAGKVLSTKEEQLHGSINWLQSSEDGPPSALERFSNFTYNKVIPYTEYVIVWYTSTDGVTDSNLYNLIVGQSDDPLQEEFLSETYIRQNWITITLKIKRLPQTINY